MQKIDDLKKKQLINFQSIDQNFTVNCKAVWKIAVSIIKAAVLVSARKNYATDSLQCRLPSMLRLPKQEKLDLV